MPVLSNTDGKLVSSRFSRAAAHYDRYAEHQRQVAEELACMVRGVPCRTILELGCGTGILSEVLRNTHPEAHLLLTDSAPGMVSVCRTRVHPSSLVRHSLWDFEESESPGTFDLVVSSCSLQWLRNPLAFGSRIRELVSSSGCTAHAIPVKGMLREFAGSFSKTGAEWPSLNYLSGNEWDSMFADSGFEVKQSFTAAFPVRYGSPAEALRAVMGIGASLAGHRGAAALKPGVLRSALDYYGENYRDREGMVPATYEVHFILAAGN